MVTQQEIDMIIEWCEKIKTERNRIYIIERNPFRDDMKWMRNKVYVEIDRPRSIANKMSVVYDSTTKSLWEYSNMTWRRIIPDV